VEILKSGVDLFLTHGGQNSFTESLAVGVPVVVCPGFGDQKVNARKAVTLGVGLQVERPVPENGAEAQAVANYRNSVRNCLERVSTSDAFKQAACGCGARLKAAGGVGRAVELITALAKKKAASPVSLPSLLTSMQPKVDRMENMKGRGNFLTPAHA